MDKEVATYTMAELTEGQSFSFTRTITQADIDAFIALTGDISPLHVEDEFAQSRGFERHVVHGLLVGSLLSTMVGVYLPGRNALLQCVNLKFLQPVYVDDTLKIQVQIDQISKSTNVIVLQALIENSRSGAIVARGKLQVGLTRENE
jgi:3-hydroxybutyryl-CoA dehydratase